MYATCETDGCANSFIPIPLLENHGQVFCGPCGNPVTDITDIKPEEGSVLPEWILEKLQDQNSDA